MSSYGAPYEQVTYEVEGAIATLTMNRPEKRNPLNAMMFGELVDALHAAEDDDEVKVVILRGAGPTFCSGHDLSAVGHVYGLQDNRRAGDGAAALRQPGQRVRLTFDQRMMEHYRAFLYSMKPVIGQVHGHCIGGGVYLVEMLDLAIAAEDATFSHAEQRLMGGGRSFTPVVDVLTLGPKKAREFLLLGPFDGVEAARLGLVNKAVPEADLDAAVREWAERICRFPKDALVIGKAFNQLALDSLGASSQFAQSYIGHTLATNLKFDEGEFNFLRARRDQGVTDAVKTRDAHYTEFEAGTE